MLQFLTRPWVAAPIGLAVLLGGFLVPVWLQAIEENERSAVADPHHIAGNLFFVGTPSEASFLLTSNAGHVLIDTGYSGQSSKLVDSISQLGFDVADIKVLLVSDPHIEHAGGLKAIQQASGAALWASEANAEVLVTGGTLDASIVYTPHWLFHRIGITDYPAPVVDHRLVDGQTIRVGPIAVTAHLTPGHSPGCTSFTFTVRDQGPRAAVVTSAPAERGTGRSTAAGTARDLRVVHRCELQPPIGASLLEPEQYPGIRGHFEQAFRTLRGLPVDIWLTSHGREYGRYRKYQESVAALAAGGDPVAPFIDPQGYAESIDRAEAKVRTLLEKRPAP